MILSICIQNGKTLRSLQLTHCKDATFAGNVDFVKKMSCKQSAIFFRSLACSKVPNKRGVPNKVMYIVGRKNPNFIIVIIV